MKYLPDLIINVAFGALALGLIPMYGEVVSGLFDQVSHSLNVVNGRI